MFSLVYGFWKHWSQREEYYVLILGLDNAGKTTFLEHAKVVLSPNQTGVKPMNLSKISCTVGLNIGKIHFQDIILNFWDLGGQTDLQCLWEKYYSESHAIIFVIDASDSKRLQESKQVFEQMITNDILAELPLLVIANKQDVKDSLTCEQIEEEFHLKQFDKTNRPYHFCAISALEGDGLKDCIAWIGASVKQNAHIKPPIECSN